MQHSSLIPRHPVPALNLTLVSGGRYVLGAEPGDKFALLGF